MSTLKIAIILLAAGSSSRMGQNKLLMKNGQETLLENALRAATSSSVDDVIVVTGSNRTENETIINNFPVTISFNANWEKGIGSSIKCGLQLAKTRIPNLDAVIISVCDQPFLNKDIFNRLIDQHHKSGKPVTASEYEGSLGVPVLYNKSMVEELLKIPDDQGAKKNLLTNMDPNSLDKVPFSNGGIDIDSVDDLSYLNN
jgi:molybdenum cofactor cytidylyltransferase